MIFSIKGLTDEERTLCKKTISPKALYALVGDAIVKKESISIVRMGDGERKILASDAKETFTDFERDYTGWNERLGIHDMPIENLRQNILDAGNTCTYFAPSVSGISYPGYRLYDFFEARSEYYDNFFVNDWTKEMIQRLLEASDGVCILHRDHESIIKSFQNNYSFAKPVHFEGFTKHSWEDNDAAIAAAMNSKSQLILFSAGPGGKIIAPSIAQGENKIVIDVGNTLIPWSEKV